MFKKRIKLQEIKLKPIKLSYFSLILSFINLVLYHFAFYKFVFNNVDVRSLNGIVIIVSLTFIALLLNAMIFYIGLFLLRFIGKYLLVLLFNINAITVYFIATYGVIIDRTMIGNILNTNYEESSSFLSFTLFVYLIFLGLIPSIIILKVKTLQVRFKRFITQISISLILLLSIAYANAPNWLWIDKNSKTLGALVMPWSYIVNTARYYAHESKKNEKEILLPNATLKNSEKSVVVLVIGESARRMNFSLYGYDRDTNPLLSKLLKTDNLHVYKAESAATYTTAGVKAILDYKETNDLYEVLPNYLFRNGIEVLWRTSNWGEPNIKIKDYQDKHELAKLCTDISYEYDEILLCDLKKQILESQKDKMLIVLHTSTSHGPTYYKKYPPQFGQFTPICESVELSKCTKEELVNAYDNTILYTDYILSNLIKTLKELDGYTSSMIYISDHGESLGEKNLYMHGVPMSIAPKEQFEIPFIVWTSDKSTAFKSNETLSQYNIFHSVLDFLAVESSIYDKNKSILNK